MIYNIFKKLDLAFSVDNSNNYEINIKDLSEIEINKRLTFKFIDWSEEECFKRLEFRCSEKEEKRL